jgi:anti-anti-sigma regulatory factor
MNVKSLLLVVMTVTLLAAMAFWAVGMFKKQSAEQAGEDPGNIFMECPECHLKLRVSLETAKKGMMCPHCVREGIGMQRKDKLLSGAVSGAHFYYQLLAMGLVSGDAIMLLLCYYFYWIRPASRKRKSETATLSCTCPTCHRKYRYKRTQIGQAYQCHNCRRNFSFPDPEARTPPAPQPSYKSQFHTALLPGQEPPHDIHRKRFYLIVANGSKRGLPIRVTDDLFVVGSEKECQLRSNHRDIGPRHFSLATRLNKVFVRDWNSGQPTLVNDALLPPGEEWPVHAGDYIKAGPLEFLVQFREPSVAQQDLEEWALRCLDADEKRDELHEFDPNVGFNSERLAGASNVAAQVISKMMEHKGVEEGRLRIFHQADILIIRFNDARLLEESEIALVRKEIQDHVDQPAMRILLDFKNVRRLSSAAVDMLTDLSRWLAGQHSRLALCRLSPDLNWILATLNAIHPVVHFPDKHSALKSSW